MKKAEFLKMVMVEIETIKERATAEEIGKLDFDGLIVLMPHLCIYGQMTGSCCSQRAKRIFGKMFEYVAVDGRNNCDTFSKWSSKSGNEFTPLEVYITMKGAKNKEVIQYLKGEINTLTL